MKKIGNLIFGIILVLVGTLFLLINFNIISNLSYLAPLKNFWPIGFILAGILLIFKQKGLSLLIFILTILLGLFLLIVPSSNITYEKHVEINNIELESNISEAEYTINFGAGVLNIEPTSDNNNLVENALETYTNGKTNIEYTKKQNLAKVEINKAGPQNIKNFYQLIQSTDDNLRWDLRLNPNVNSSIKLNYGASETILDLRKLNISELEIDCGASDTQIEFGNNKLNGEISTGLADFTLNFHKDVGIIVEVEGGLTDVNLKGFKKENNKYSSPNHNTSNENINIKIESGLTSIQGGLTNAN